MTNSANRIKFDQDLWDARGEGYRSEDEAQNPYLATSAKWAAWFAGRAFGLGRIATSRGENMNVEVNGRSYRFSFDDIAARAGRERHQPHVTYLHGAR